MLKLYYKFKKRLKAKGFTLVELLAVIVILAIIMIIAIPAILETMESAKRKSFITYVDKLGNNALERLVSDSIIDKPTSEGCYIYNIENDLNLANTGDYKGYVLISTTNNNPKYYFSIWSNDYMLIAYNYTDRITYDNRRKELKDALERYDESRKDELMPASLCNYACNTCIYENASNDTNITDGSIPTNLNGDITKIKGITKLIKGTDFYNLVKVLTGDVTKVKYFKKGSAIPDGITTKTISENTDESNKNPVYIWYDDSSETLYFYSEASKIFLNKNCEKMFYHFSKLINLDDFITNTYTNLTTSMLSMFNGCVELKSINLTNYDTSNVTNMNYLFYNCYNLESVDVSKFNTSNLTTMIAIFDGCSKLTHLDVSNWDTSKVTSFALLFSGCSSLEELPISNWNTSSLTTLSNDYESIFSGCSNIKRLDLSKWNVSNVTSFGSLFFVCSLFVYLNVSNWDTSNVIKMNGAFANTTMLKTVDIKNWNVRKVENMSNMFWSSGLDEIDLSTWTTPSLKHIDNMFRSTKAVSINADNFDVTHVTKLPQVFYGVGKLEVISIVGWDTSNVTQMYRTFADSSVRHIYVGSKWSTSSLVDPPGEEGSKLMFHNAKHIHNWNNERGPSKAHTGEGGYLELKP